MPEFQEIPLNPTSANSAAPSSVSTGKFQELPLQPLATPAKSAPVANTKGFEEIPLDSLPEKQDNTSVPSVPLSNPTSNSTSSANQPSEAGTPTKTGEVVAAKLNTSPSSQSNYQQIEDQSAAHHWYQHPILTDSVIKNSELGAIASHFKVDPSTLRASLPLLDASGEDASISETLGKWSSGLLGEGVLLGLPQKLLTQISGDQKLQDALDEVRKLSSERKSVARVAAEGLASLVIPAGKVAEGAGIAGKALYGAAVGAGFGGLVGLGSSSRGEEISNTASGAVGGSVLGATGAAAVEGASQLLKKAGVPAEEIADKFSSKSIQSEVQKTLDANTSTNESMLKSIQDGISPEKLDSKLSTEIAREQIPQVDNLGDAVKPNKAYISPKGEDKWEPAVSVNPKTNPEITEHPLYSEEQPNFYKHSEAGEDKILHQTEADYSYGNQLRSDEVTGRDVYESRLLGFAKELDPKAKFSTPEDALEVIKNYTEKSGNPELESRWNEFISKKTAEDYIYNTGTELDAAGTPRNWFRKLEEGQDATANIERETGVKLATTHSQWNQALNLKHQDSVTFKADLGNVVKTFGRETASSPQVTEELLSGQVKSEPAKMLLRIAQDSEDWTSGQFKKAHPDVNWATPVSTTKKLTKLNPQLVEQSQLTGLFDRQISSSLEQAGLDKSDITTLDPTSIKKLFSTDAGKELQIGLKLVGKRTDDIKSGMQLQRIVEDLVSTPTSDYLLKSLGSKTPQIIPDFLQEKNPVLLVRNLVDTNLSKLYLDKPLRGMLVGADQLQRAKAFGESDYVRRLVSDNLGINRPSVPGIVNAVGLRASRYLDRLDNSTSSQLIHGATATARAIPVVEKEIMNSVHSNLVGLNPGVVLKHYASVFTRMVPELGSTSSALSTVLQGLVQNTANFRFQLAKTKMLGLTPPAEMTAIREGVQTELRNSPIAARGQEFLHGAQEFLTYALQRGYEHVKSIGLSTGEVLAYKLSKGDQGAVKLLQKLPESVQLEVQHIGYQNFQQTGIIIGRHLGDVIAKNYNKASQAEFIRTVGSAVGMFQKWPSVAAADLARVVNTPSTGGALGKLGAVGQEGLVRLVLPYSALAGLQYALFGPEDKWSDRTKYMMGTGGVAAASSLGTDLEVGQRIQGDKKFQNTPLPFRVLSMPAVQMMYNTAIHPLIIGAEETYRTKSPEAGITKAKQDFESGFARAVQTGMPLARYAKFITQDLPLLVTGKKTEGTNFINKTASGIGRYQTEIPRKLQEVVAPTK